MENIEFQIYDYMETNEIIDDNEEDDSESNNSIGKYIIHTFGRTEDGRSVYCKITNYCPYFYILLPDKVQHKSDYEINIISQYMYNYLVGKDNRKVFGKFKQSLKNIDIVRLKKSEGFTNDKKYYFAKLNFTNSEGMRKYRNLFDYNDVVFSNIMELAIPHKYKLYEANLPPMFRCFHIKNISGCSWVQTSKYNQIEIEDDKESLCDIELIVNWKHLNPIIKDFNAPFRIASFDIECTSEDGAFPQARRKGDQIIQIGVTYTLLGQNLPYRNYIACLNKTSAIENVVVNSFETEKELLLDFLNEINTNDCDIITGYNIFFFDEKYMYDRCKRDDINIELEMSYISKLKNHRCIFKEMKLASSALGENLLRYWDTPGRVHIDLMKDVQKTFNLPSYKLDNVASKFIRGQVSCYTKLENNMICLECKSVDDIYMNDYIHLEIIKGFISDEIGDKYNVLDVDYKNKKIIIQSTEDFIKDLELVKPDESIFWSQAKDDITPKDIFRLQKGSSRDRAIVAKYCIKDCKLVNILINKLEVVTKNIEMANVCYVPLSYLFIRGQGIKLFSLCLKEFREQEYAFPVIRMDKNYKCLDKSCQFEFKNSRECKRCKTDNIEELKDEQSSYEGAIVFDPVPKVDYEACATKDYMSLYPASIMHKNMSHETIVENPEYDNLPNITYYNASYREADGSIQYRRYAKKEDKLGVIPSILNNLLKTRKSIKKLMKTEKDQFKYKILDAKQLAVKITANSLYGQLGASTSPICKRDIAACTTSTGREMLIFAKKYDEEILPWLMNGLKHAYFNDDTELLDYLYSTELKERDDKLIDNIHKYLTVNLKDLIFQPVVRYGDTDSIFSCYRFREYIVKVDDNIALGLLRKIIEFGKELILPFIDDKNKSRFNEIYSTYYSCDMIIDLTLPASMITMKEPSNQNVLLPVKERIKIFIKEYIQESYFPWLWTLQELVMKDYMNLFDIKLFQWAEHQVNKMRINYVDLYEKRRNEVMIPMMEYINNKFNIDNNKKINIDEFIGVIKEILGKELIVDDKLMIKHVKQLEKNINERWVKYNGKKELDEIIEDFITKQLNINFNKYKDELSDKVKYFVHNVLEDRWIQPRWSIVNSTKVYNVDFYEGGKPIIDKRTLDNAIEMGKLSGELVKSRLPFPHDLEYEKTFWPFAIVTKKKYVGNKYEFDNNKCKQDFMGIVLKRRDNAAIVKEICGGIIDQLINKRSPSGAKDFTTKCLTDMFEGKYDIRYFLQSRNLKLKDSYKDWRRIAHIYLADKISQRDPGFTPQSGDRIEFVVIKVEQPEDGSKLLQGDMIEVPSYVKQHNLEIDYMFYLTNQIMNPALQFLELVDKDAKNIFNDIIAKYSAIKKPKINQKKIDSLYKIEVKKTIKEINTKINATKKLYNNKTIKDIKNIFNKIDKIIKKK
jgi:DNA polymerase elongation subunit (family B)